jgi:hypothetical protein
VTSVAIWSRFQKNYKNCTRFIGSDRSARSSGSVNVDLPNSLVRSAEISFVTEERLVEVKGTLWSVDIGLKQRLMGSRNPRYRTHPNPDKWTDALFGILEDTFAFLCNFPMTFVNQTTLCSSKCRECGASMIVSVVENEEDQGKLNIIFSHPTKNLPHNYKRPVKNEKRKLLAAEILSSNPSTVLMNKRLALMNAGKFIGKKFEFKKFLNLRKI